MKTNLEFVADAINGNIWKKNGRFRVYDNSFKSKYGEVKAYFDFSDERTVSCLNEAVKGTNASVFIDVDEDLEVDPEVIAEVEQEMLDRLLDKLENFVDGGLTFKPRTKETDSTFTKWRLLFGFIGLIALAIISLVTFEII